MALLHPRDGQTLIAGQPMQPWAAASDQAGEPLSDEVCRWELDGEGVGTSKELWLTAPRPGEHEVALTVAAGREDVRIAATFTTVGEDGKTEERQHTES